MTWYYALNGQQLGPVVESELSRLVSTGVVGADALIWREGMPDWQPVSVALPHLLAAAAPPDAPQMGGVVIPEAHKDFVVQQIREGVPTLAMGGLRYGGFWMRVLAKIIDYMIVNSVLVAFYMVTALFIGMGGSSHQDEMQLAIVVVQQVVGLAATCAYYSIMVGKYGATLGKMALGMRIVRPDGSPVSMGLAVGRFFAEMLSGLTCSIGYIIAAFDDEKRALHDHVCGTRVIFKQQ